MSKISLITFDVTNTLMRLKNSIGFEYLRIAEIYCNQNIIKSNSNRNQCQNQLSKAFKTVWKDMNTNHPNFGLNSGMSSVQWWTQMVRKTFRSAEYSEQDISDKRLDIISNHLFKHYSSANCWTIDGNSHKVLSHLKNNCSDLSIGVISNSDERLDHILHEIGLRHYFHFVLISRTANSSKPFRDIFDLGLKCGQLSDASQALHIGDDLDLDYLSAKSFGWNALLFRRDGKLSAEELAKIDSKDIICDLSQLIDHSILKQNYN